MVVKNPLIRKLSKIPRRMAHEFLFRTQQTTGEGFSVFLNSFPKSGTHLLIQIIESLPGVRNYGRFCASTPTLSYKLRSPESESRFLLKALNNEVLCGHMHYSESANNAVKQKNMLHYFIYRDLRDVCVSEAYYLTYMNKWHKLHKLYASIPTDAERILLAIQGYQGGGVSYPNIHDRFNAYAGWLETGNVIAVRFEDLRGDAIERTVSEIVHPFVEKVKKTYSVEKLIDQAIQAINPEKSHTFNKGTTQRWKKAFSDEHKDVFKEVAGDMLVELGYETDLSW